MQTVKCYLENCNYNADGWCQKKTLVVIDQNGMCKNIWHNGSIIKENIVNQEKSKESD